jgi:hypothetical protein
MDKEESKKTMLNMDYSKLLAYVGGGLVSFFALFQISTEVEKLPWPIIIIISSTVCFGVFIFTHAGYKNWEEIIEFENELGISEFVKPSGWFSKKSKANDKMIEVTRRLKWGCRAFIGLSIVICGYCWYRAIFNIIFNIVI